MLHLRSLPKMLLLTLFMGSPSLVLFAQCKSGDCKTGVGMYVYSESTIYEGNFKDGLPNGTGRLIRSNGDEYVGTFIDGLYSGEGQLKFANGDVYTGQFKQGLRDGKGVLLKKDGTIIQGPFTNNVTPGTKATYMSVDSMGFYTGALPDNVSVSFDKAGTIWLDSTAFDPRTGQILAERKPDAGQPPLMLQFKGKLYKVGSTEFSAYMRDKYAKSKYHLVDAILKEGPDYYIGRSETGSKKEGNMYYPTRFYKISSDKIEEIAVMDFWLNAQEKFVFADDLSLIFSINKRMAYTQGGTHQVPIPIETYGYKEKSLYEKLWLSPGNDTLFHLVEDKPIQEVITNNYPPFTLTLRKYLVADGKLVSTEKLGNNTRLKGIHGGCRMAGFDYQRRQAVVSFSSYLSNVYVYGGGQTLNSVSYKQAALVHLDDPDYLLPLKNPAYDKAYFEGVEKGVRADWNAYLDDRRKAQEAAAKRRADEKWTYVSLEDEMKAKRDADKPAKKSGGAGVCIWCKGAGKVTSKDVYNKGYNSNYTGGGGGKFTLGRGNESFSTETCPICAGSGY